MNARPENQSVVRLRPPQLIQSLSGGFNIVANNIYLIFLPAVLDLLLWFGPHLRLKTLFEPLIMDFIKIVRNTSPSEMQSVWEGMETLWQTFLTQFNLLSVLSAFPFGVPTLMSSQSPLQTPIGAAPVYEMNSLAWVALLWLGLGLAGLGLGSFYYAIIAQGCGRVLAGVECPEIARLPKFNGKIPPLRLDVLAWEALQVLAIVAFLLLLGLVVAVPAIFLASLLALISPFLAQVALLFFIMGALWLLMPLVFSPHGIFLCGLNVINAMLTSARVVRYSLSGTGLFLATAIILNQGLSLLWSVPADNSWLALVGILGHAFIATALLAASFIYYHNGLAYAQSVRNLLLSKRNIQ